MLSKQKIVEMLVHLISGASAGAISTSVSYPFTNIRQKAISNDLKKTSEEEIYESMHEKQNKDKNKLRILIIITNHINNILDSIKKDGCMSLYNGLSSSLLGSVFQNGVYFCSSKFWSYLLEHMNFKQNFFNSLIINLLAAICSTIITNPIWVLNIRMINKSKEENYGNIGMICKIFKEEGISGFFKGIVPSLILTLNPVIQFTTYDIIKKFLTKKSHRENLSSFEILIASFVSKFITIISNYPLITLKTLYMANSTKNSHEMVELISDIYRNEGILGFYKGITMKILGSVINNIILMMCYEKIQIGIRLFLARIFLKNSIISDIN